MKPIRPRHAMLAAALLLSAAATGWLAAQESGAPVAVEAVAPAARAAQPVSAAGKREGGTQDARDLRLDILPRNGTGAVKELFAARDSHAQAPQQAAQPLPPPAPTAPPVPFTVIGKMIYAGRTSVLLTHQDRSFAVNEGEVIGEYRVDSIRGSLMTLTYLPLDTRHTMHIGDPN